MSGPPRIESSQEFNTGCRAQKPQAQALQRKEEDGKPQPLPAARKDAARYTLAIMGASAVFLSTLLFVTTRFHPSDFITGVIAAWLAACTASVLAKWFPSENPLFFKLLQLFLAHRSR